jgi:penicillin-binding protein 1B
LTWRQAPARRFYYHATSRIVLAPLLIISLILIGVLFYYYSRYAAIIDKGLHGELFVRSSGIYAAPLTLRNGGGPRMNELVGHLRKVGYQDSGAVGNDKRGRYAVRGATVDIYPGSDSVIDNEKVFPNLRVVFSRGGEVVQSITDLDNQQRLGQAEVEPELISSVVNQEREKRKIIEYKDLPQTLVDAITAIEDRQFFDHAGINWRGVLRALFRDYQAGEWREGGSSITQQLVKNIYLKPERTWKRKFSEAYMSIILEQRLSKEEIMAMYCNQIYLGQRGGFSINGFGEAARAYFGKDVSHLTIQESALLAGIIKSPNYYSPFSHEERARERRNLVLDKMVEAEKITVAQAEGAKKASLGVVSRAGAMDVSDAPYFIDYLTRQLESQYDERAGSVRSLRIYSTIDLDLQHAAYQAVTRNMAEVDRLMEQRRRSRAGLQCALVAMNAKTGEILAMVGGRDYTQSQLNRATEARRQPGSVFKPFVYASAIALGGDEINNPITTATMFYDEPKTFGGTYSPSNYGDKFEMRPMTVRDALVQSKNVITVEIAHIIGFAQVVRMAERAGLSKVPAVPSVALGVAEATPLQMASAYTSFANQGRRVLPIAIKRVTTKDGSTLFGSRTETREVMSPQVAYIMTSMMQDVLDRGTGTRVRQMGFTGTAAGKTGSSRDAWFAGYTSNLVCIVWVGYDDNSDIGLTGGVIAAPIWGDFMMRALRLRPELGGAFEDPGDLVTYEIDSMTGALAQGDSPYVRRELFLKGTEPGGGQALPDHSIPETEPPRIPDSELQREPPRSPGSDSTSADVSGIDTELIPLPPEARKTRPRPDAEPAPTPKRSFSSKVREFFGFGKSTSAETTPQPAPETRPRPTPRATATPRPITYSPTPTPTALTTVTATTTPRPAVSPKPKPARTPQVATRPRKVASKKTNELPKPKADDRAVKLDKSSKDKKARDKLGDSRKDEKKSDRKVEPKPAIKQPEAKKTNAQVANAATPPPTPTPKPSPTATPPPAAPPAPRGDGTFTLEVCSLTGLLPVRGVCKTTTRQRFKLGSEPTKFCSPSRHGGN